jgi:dihydroorotate dehydrogenase electron transfer subunit
MRYSEKTNKEAYMQTYTKARVISCEEAAESIYKMVLDCPQMASDSKPGQFINLYLDRGEMILPRPISICDADKNSGTLTVLFQIAGAGTRYLSTISSGQFLNISGPLGNSYAFRNVKNFAFISGGIGTPPMFFGAKYLKMSKPDAQIKVFASFRSKNLVVLENEFKELDIEYSISTGDGSYGIKGNSLNAFKDSKFEAEMIFTCGPLGMVKAVSQYAIENNIHCQVSMEERMGCALGACYGCAVAVVSDTPEGFKYKKVCKDGPVFDAKEVYWQ